MGLELVGDTPLEAAVSEVLTFGGSESNDLSEESTGVSDTPASDIPATSPDKAAEEQTPLEAAAEEVAGEEDPEAELLREVQGARARKRIAQLNKQKLEAREAKAKAETERDAFKAKLDDYDRQIAEGKPFADLIETHYSKYSDPVKAAEFDIQFMNAFEVAAKANPALGKIAQQIADSLAKGETVSVDPKTAAAAVVEPAKPAAPAKDERVEKILVREATTAATALLTELKVEPRFAKLITKELIAKQGYDREPTKAEVVAAAKAFAEDNGFALAELSGKTAPVKKPVLATGGAPGADLPAGSGGTKGDEKPRPKDMNEWERGRQARLASLGIK